MNKNAFDLYWYKLIPSVANILGNFWFSIHERRREIAISNIVTALQINYSKAKEIARKNFIHLSRVFLEFLLIPYLDSRNIQSIVSYKGGDNFLETRNKYGGFFILTGHFGNWELMAYATPLLTGYTFDIVVRPIDNGVVNRIVHKIRTKTGNRIIEKKDSVWKISESIRNNRVVGMLLDQKASHKEGIYVPLFNRQVLTHKALALISLKTSYPVLPVYNHRTRDGKYNIYVMQPIFPEKGKSLRTRVFETTLKYNKVFEKIVMKDPSQWYWIHRRFRYSKPLLS